MFQWLIIIEKSLFFKTQRHSRCNSSWLVYGKILDSTHLQSPIFQARNSSYRMTLSRVFGLRALFSTMTKKRNCSNSHSSTQSWQSTRMRQSFDHPGKFLASTHVFSKYSSRWITMSLWKSRFSLKIRCAIDLTNYPLDIQTCYFRMRLSELHFEFLEFFANNRSLGMLRPTTYVVHGFSKNHFSFIKWNFSGKVLICNDLSPRFASNSWWPW
jgi:hypothetical protein